ncbi:MAG: hypothetical protein U0R18_16305 [Mycobacterium sp.]
MTETTEHTVDTPVAVERQPNRLYQIAAWVGIAAGTVFIVAVIFFSGFLLGRHSGGGHFGGHGSGHGGPGMMMDRPWGPGPMRGGPGGPGDRDDRGPGMMPGMMRPGGAGDGGTNAPTGPGTPVGPGAPQQPPATPGR